MNRKEKQQERMSEGGKEINFKRMNDGNRGRTRG